eukprot:scaffold5266_cov116-Isochrysis_galbana.AAC.1
MAVGARDMRCLVRLCVSRRYACMDMVLVLTLSYGYIHAYGIHMIYDTLYGAEWGRCVPGVVPCAVLRPDARLKRIRVCAARPPGMAPDLRRRHLHMHSSRPPPLRHYQRTAGVPPPTSASIEHTAYRYSQPASPSPHTPGVPVSCEQ